MEFKKLTEGRYFCNIQSNKRSVFLYDVDVRCIGYFAYTKVD